MAQSGRGSANSGRGEPRSTHQSRGELVERHTKMRGVVVVGRVHRVEVGGRHTEGEVIITVEVVNVVGVVILEQVNDILVVKVGPA